MRRFKFIFNWFLLCSIPFFIFHQVEAATLIIPQSESTIEVVEQKSILDGQLYSYEEILNFIDSLENGTLEDIYTAEELDNINHFIATLAREGQLPCDSDEELILEKDIEELLEEGSNDYTFAVDQDGNYTIVPAVFSDSYDVILCKHFFKKKWKKIKKFVKKHKKEIIIGAVVVVAVTTVVVVAVVCASGAGAAAAAGAGAVAATQNSPSTEKGNSAPSSENMTSSQSSSVSPPSTEVTLSSSSVNEVPHLSEVLEEHVSSFKEMVVEDGLLEHLDCSAKGEKQSFGETAKEMGSYLVHEALENVSQMVSIIPAICEEMKKVEEKILPKKDSICEGSPSENYEKTFTSGHEIIDKVFSTDQAKYYTSEAKENLNKLHPDPVIGILPPPGALGFIAEKDCVGRLLPTQTNSTKRWKLGEPINNRTIMGKEPKWNVVRQRTWKNKAYYEPEKYTSEELKRMKKGLAPRRFNDRKGKWESKELHHDPRQSEGGMYDLIEAWPDEHAAMDPHRYVGK